jgi:hypothetical protein
VILMRIVLFVLVGLFAVLLQRELFQEPASAEAPAGGEVELPALPPAPAFAPPPPEDFAELASRPLFAPSRRPPAPPVAPPAEAEAEPTPAVAAAPLLASLVGITITGEGRAALIAVPGARARWLREGEAFEGWRVEAILANAVRLSRGDEAAELELPRHP